MGSGLRGSGWISEVFVKIPKIKFRGGGGSSRGRVWPGLM